MFSSLEILMYALGEVQDLIAKHDEDYEKQGKSLDNLMLNKDQESFFLTAINNLASNLKRKVEMGSQMNRIPHDGQGL